MRAAGHRFRTRSDTEVIVHAFEEWGEGAWSRFNGQYAFALWDANERRLWLVRDPMGIVPLFVRADEHAVMFASEMKSLFAGGAPAVEIDRHSLHTAFTLWSTPAPRTLFRGVESIEPGQAMYLPAGVLHSYLGGVGIELMASSDNVLRGGLTEKHVDLPELLRVLRFEPGGLARIAPEPIGPCELRYGTPAEEFELSLLHVRAPERFEARERRGVEILLCTQGEGSVKETPKAPARSSAVP